MLLSSFLFCRLMGMIFIHPARCLPDISATFEWLMWSICVPLRTNDQSLTRLIEYFFPTIHLCYFRTKYGVQGTSVRLWYGSRSRSHKRTNCELRRKILYIALWESLKMSQKVCNFENIFLHGCWCCKFKQKYLNSPNALKDVYLNPWQGAVALEFNLIVW